MSDEINTEGKSSPSHIPSSLEGLGPQLPESNRGEGIGELDDLLNNPSFREGYIQVQTKDQRDAIIGLDKKVNEAASRQAQLIIEREAAASLGMSVEEARKLGKDWGKKLQEIRSSTISIKNPANTSETLETLSRGDYYTRLALDREKQNPDYFAHRESLDSDLNKAVAQREEELSRLTAEFGLRRDDPHLLAALKVWGRSPNAQGEFGGGDGFNAGIIHFFEYRANLEKNGRYKNDQTTVTLDGFIEYSGRIKNLIEDPNPTNNPNIQKSSLIADENGQYRLFVLTKEGQLLVGFRRHGEIGLPRVITIMPGQDEKRFDKAVSDELTAARPGRLNNLEGKRREMPIGEFHKLNQEGESPQIAPAVEQDLSLEEDGIIEYPDNPKGLEEGRAKLLESLVERYQILQAEQTTILEIETDEDDYEQKPEPVYSEDFQALKEFVDEAFYPEQLAEIIRPGNLTPERRAYLVKQFTTWMEHDLDEYRNENKSFFPSYRAEEHLTEQVIFLKRVLTAFQGRKYGDEDGIDGQRGTFFETFEIKSELSPGINEEDAEAEDYNVEREIAYIDPKTKERLYIAKHKGGGDDYGSNVDELDLNNLSKVVLQEILSI
jgi:hypothetical protein